MNRRRFVIWACLALGFLAALTALPAVIHLLNPPARFVVASADRGPSEPLVTRAEWLPKSLILSIIAGSVWREEEGLEVYLTEREEATLFESWRHPETGWYDLRPLFTNSGFVIPENMTAWWDPRSECAIFEVPEGVAPHLGSLFRNRPTDEWDRAEIFLRCTVFQLKASVESPEGREIQAMSLRPAAIEVGDLERFATRLEILDEVRLPFLSGERTKAELGVPGTKGVYRVFECEPILGADRITIDALLSHEFQHPEEAVSHKVNTQLAMQVGSPHLMQVGATADGKEVRRIFLLLDTNRVTRSGKFFKHKDFDR